MYALLVETNGNVQIWQTFYSNFRLLVEPGCQIHVCHCTKNTQTLIV